MIAAGLEPLWTDILLAWASVATAVILVVAGCIAWWQASEARRLRRAQSRPFVVIDFDAQSIHLFVFLRIANVGTTMARDVSFKFAPGIQSTFDSDPNLPGIGDLAILKNGIRSLPPGKEISFLFDHVPDRKKKQLPDTYTVTIKYEGEEVKRLFTYTKREQFTDETTLDLSIYWNLTHITRRSQHDIHERLQEIRDVLKRWSASGGSGLLALSRDDVKKRDEEWLAQVRQREQKQRAETSEKEEGQP